MQHIGCQPPFNSKEEEKSLLYERYSHGELQKVLLTTLNNIAALNLSNKVPQKSCDGLLSGGRSYHADSL
jgi:hypothetical protein